MALQISQTTPESNFLHEKKKSAIKGNYVTLFIHLFGCALSIWKFLGQGQQQPET